MNGCYIPTTEFVKIPMTVIGGTSNLALLATVSSQSSCYKSDSTCDECLNVSRNVTKNRQFSISQYIDFPEFNLTPTFEREGGIWINDIFHGMGTLDSPVPEKPYFFGGIKIAQIPYQNEGYSSDVLVTNSKIMLKRIKNEVTSRYIYKGFFLKFRVNEDDESEIESPFMRYQVDPDDTDSMDQPFINTLRDFNKLTLVSSVVNNGKPINYEEEAMLKTRNYSNRSPVSFRAYPNSSVSLVGYTNPLNSYCLKYSLKANLCITCDDAILQGTNITPLQLGFSLDEAINQDTGEESRDFPKKIIFDYRLEVYDYKYAKLTAYLQRNDLSDNFIKAISNARETNYYNGSLKGENRLEDIRGVIGFSTFLEKSDKRYSYDWRSSMDNTIFLDFNLRF